MPPPVEWPLPPCQFYSKDGYDHCPPGANKTHVQWNAITGNGTFFGALLRLLSGYKLSGGKWVTSRWPGSYISLDGGSWGIAHHHSGTAPEWFSDMVRACPSQASWAWGAPTAQLMQSEDWIASQIPDVRGDMHHNPALDWLLAGWWEIASEPGWIAAQIYYWAGNYVLDGEALCRRYGWSSARALAACTRMANSKGEKGARKILDRAVDLVGYDETKALEWAYLTESKFGGYGHEDRWTKLTTWPEFRGPAPAMLDVFSLNLYGAPVVRIDGSIPEWKQRGYQFERPNLAQIILSYEPDERRQRLKKKPLIPTSLKVAGGAYLLWKIITR